MLCGGSWASCGCLKHLCLTTDQDLPAILLCIASAEWATVLFVIQLSIGESIWSPRWYDYSMSVAPEGREGVFTAMASAPLFLGKFVTGKSQSDCVRVSCTLQTKPSKQCCTCCRQHCPDTSCHEEHTAISKHQCHEQVVCLTLQQPPLQRLSPKAVMPPPVLNICCTHKQGHASMRAADAERQTPLRAMKPPSALSICCTHEQGGS